MASGIIHRHASTHKKKFLCAFPEYLIVLFNLLSPYRSQSSMISDASDEDTRHLALVFFDILMIDSKSLMQNTYAERRVILESTIIPRHGFSIVAERTAIPVDGGPNPTSVGHLEDVFAKLIASHEEGAVLKADEGKYRDWRFPWVKVISSSMST